MAKYLDTSVLAKLCEIRKRIYKEREDFYKEFKIDLLDTDTLSSSAIYEISIHLVIAEPTKSFDTPPLKSESISIRK